MFEGLVHLRLDPGQDQTLPPRPGVVGHLGYRLGTGGVQVVGAGQAQHQGLGLAVVDGFEPPFEDSAPAQNSAP